MAPGPPFPEFGSGGLKCISTNSNIYLLLKYKPRHSHFLHHLSLLSLPFTITTSTFIIVPLFFGKCFVLFRTFCSLAVHGSGWSNTETVTAILAWFTQTNKAHQFCFKANTVEVIYMVSKGMMCSTHSRIGCNSKRRHFEGQRIVETPVRVTANPVVPSPHQAPWLCYICAIWMLSLTLIEPRQYLSASFISYNIQVYLSPSWYSLLSHK